MDEETQARVKETVVEILKNANLHEMTVSKLLKIASEKLDMDLSEPTRKKFVRQVVELYMTEQQGEADEQEEEKATAEREVVEVVELDEEVDSRKRSEREYDDDGGLIACRLSKYRRVTIHEYKGKTLVSIREYFTKGRKEFPTTKGISLTLEQWATFKKNIPAIDKAVMEMESM